MKGFVYVNKETFRKQVDELGIILYQNREQEALEKFPVFFLQLQEVTKELLEMNLGKVELEIYITLIYKELLDGYKNKDMLYLADCLQEKVVLLEDMYSAEKQN